MFITIRMFKSILPVFPNSVYNTTLLFQESHFIVGSPESHDASVSRMHAGSSQQIQHPGEAIVDDQHRVVYAAYAR